MALKVKFHYRTKTELKTAIVPVFVRAMDHKCI